MSGINFSLRNPNATSSHDQGDAVPVIYYDKPAESNILFSFTQDLGIPEVRPGDTFEIRFAENLLQSLSASMLASEDWEVKRLDTPNPANGQSFTVVLSPHKALPFGSLSILFANLPGKKSTNGEVSLFVTIKRRRIPIVDNTQKLFVTAICNFGDVN